MLFTERAASEGGTSSAASSRSVTDAAQRSLPDVAEIREEPPLPEPLGAHRLRVVVWVFPAVTAALLALWGPTELIGVRDAPATWLQAVWGELASVDVVLARSLLAVCAAGSAALVALLGCELGGRRTAVLAGMVYALLPGSSAMALGLGVLPVALAVAATLFAIRLIQQPTAARTAHYAVALVSVGVVAPPTLVVAVSHGVVAACCRRQRLRRTLCWAAAVATALAVVSALVGVLTLDEGLPSAAAETVPPVSALGDGSIAVFGNAVLAGAVLSLSFLALALRRGPGVATSYAIVTAGALLVMVSLLSERLTSALPIIVPGWCLLAGFALSRVRIARACCAVVLLALLGLPVQVQLRQGVVATGGQLLGVVVASSSPSPVSVNPEASR